MVVVGLREEVWDLCAPGVNQHNCPEAGKARLNYTGPKFSLGLVPWQQS